MGGRPRRGHFEGAEGGMNMVAAFPRHRLPHASYGDDLAGQVDIAEAVEQVSAVIRKGLPIGIE